MKHEIVIDDIRCHGFQNEECPHGGFRIEWDSNIGFGNLDVIFDENGKAHLYTEYMCSKEDKKFAFDLLKRMIEDAVVVE